MIVSTEQVSKYHPDKYADQISDAILTECLRQDQSTVIYDPFMGTGTTALACKKLGLSCIGSELSKEQCDYANERLLFDGNVPDKSLIDNNKESLWS